MSKPILCLDFDGVCHSYTSGWQGAVNIPDAPVDGLFEFLKSANHHFEIHIFSSRSNHQGGITAMQQWFAKYWTEYTFNKHPELKEKFSSFFCPDWLYFPTEKPAAFLTIDDRALTFTGLWPKVEDLQKFQPWYKR